MVLIISSVGVLRMPYIQTKITHYATSYIRSAYGVAISIDKLYLSFSGNLLIDDVVMYDLNNDTLFTTTNLSLDISYYNLYQNRLLVDEIEMTKPKLSLIIDSTGILNLSEVISRFKKDTIVDDTTGLFLKIYDVTITEGACEVINNKKEVSSMLNHNLPLSVSDLNFYSQSFAFQKGRIDFDIENFSFVHDRTLDTIIIKSAGGFGKGNVELNDSYLKIGQSYLACKELFTKAFAFADYSDFVNNVRIKLDVDSAFVFLSDISKIVPTVPQKDEAIEFSGVIKGLVNDFRWKDANIAYRDSSVFQGDFEIMNVTNLSEMFFLMDADKFVIFEQDVQKSKFLTDKQKEKITQSVFVNDITEIGYKGRLTGYPNDFVSEGTILTAAGIINSDVKIATDSLENYAVNGYLRVEDFDLSYMVKQKGGWGVCNASIDVNLHQRSSKTFDIKTNVAISDIEINNYLYTDLFFNGFYSNRKSTFSFVSDDPNLQVSIDGGIEKIGSTHKFYSSIDVDKIGLSSIGLFPEKYGFESSFVAKINGRGEAIDKFNTSVYIPSIEFETSKGTIKDKNSRIEIVNTENLHFINLQSKYCNASVKGAFEFKDVVSNVVDIGTALFPQTLKYVDTVSANPVNVSVHCFSDSLDVLLSVFTETNVKCSSGFKFDAELNTIDEYFQVQSEVPSFVYNNQQLDNVSLFAGYTKGSLEGNVNFDLPLKRRSFPATNLSFFAQNDQLTLDLFWKSTDSLQYNGAFYLDNHFFRDSITDSLHVRSKSKPSQIYVADTSYNLDEFSFELGKDFFHIDNFNLYDEDRSITIEGVMSPSIVDTLKVATNNFKLGSLNSVLRQFNVFLSGSLSGEIALSGAFSDRIIETESTIENLSFNGVDFGTLELLSNWEKQRKSLEYSAKSGIGDKQILEFTGSFSPSTKYLELETSIDSLDVTFLDPLMQGVLGFKKGWVRGYGFIEGHIDSLNSTGQFYARNILLQADYLNTMYAVNGPFGLYDDRLVFQNLSLKDYRNGKGKITGYFSLFNLPDLDFDLLLKTDDLHSLNTTHIHNDLFYGHAASSGTVRLQDKDGELYIAVGAEFSDGSTLFLPVNSSGEIDAENLLRFTNDTIIEEEVAEEPQDLITMDINLSFTPETEIQLIMDEQVGDVIKASGKGDVAVSIDENSNVSLLGEYDIVEGEYLFTMMNLINKRFEILPSSAIYFTGDLDDAMADIQAVYNTKATLRPIMEDLDSTQTKRVKVECLLSLTGNLFNPEIHFDINLPDNKGKAQDVISSFSDDERNKQFLSLLVLNRFSEPEGQNNDESFASASDASVNSMEVLTNQFSNWLSSISNDFDIGVNYRPGDLEMSDEIEVGVSTQILDDRITIDYNRSAAIGDEKTPNQKSDNYVGDVNVELKLTENGKLRLRGFSRESEDDPINETNSATNGVGLTFTDEFDSLKELFGRRKRKRKNKYVDQINKEAIKPEDDL